MQETIKFVIGIIIVLLGIPIGNFLASRTKDEQRAGQRWFKGIIILSLLCSFLAIILRNDILFFSFLFIAIITSRSLRK